MLHWLEIRGGDKMSGEVLLLPFKKPYYSEPEGQKKIFLPPYLYNLFSNLKQKWGIIPHPLNPAFDVVVAQEHHDSVALTTGKISLVEITISLTNKGL